MLPELFNIPGTSITVHSYGLMLVIGLLCASELARYLARRFGLRGELFINAGLLAVFSGVIGARLSHVLENLPSFTRSDLSVWQNFLNIIDIPSGGLTYYGGFLFATPVLIAYAIYHKVPVRRGMDIMAPCLVLGLAFGRIGCLLNGCCWGEVCETGPAITFPYHSPPYMEQVAAGQIKNVPDALYVTTESGGSRLITPDELRAKTALAPLAHAQHSLPVHPSQAYSAITGFILTALLVAFLTLAPAPGRVFALMLILEGGTRFLLELLRVEPAILGNGTGKLSFLPPMSVSMVIAACLFVTGIVLWLTFKSSPRDDQSSKLIK